MPQKRKKNICKFNPLPPPPQKKQPEAVLTPVVT